MGMKFDEFETGERGRFSGMPAGICLPKRAKNDAKAPRRKAPDLPADEVQAELPTDEVQAEREHEAVTGEHPRASEGPRARGEETFDGYPID